MPEPETLLIVYCAVAAVICAVNFRAIAQYLHLRKRAAQLVVAFVLFAPICLAAAQIVARPGPKPIGEALALLVPALLGLCWPVWLLYSGICERLYNLLGGAEVGGHTQPNGPYN